MKRKIARKGGLGKREERMKIVETNRRAREKGRLYEAESYW